MNGARIGLLEARLDGELAQIVRRHGGEPVRAPAVREVPTVDDAAVRAFVAGLSSGHIAVVLFLTGVGASSLVQEAERLGLKWALLNGLRRATTVCRGPKPAGVLGRHEVAVAVRVPEPHTTADVLRSMEALPLAGRTIGLLHYGERNVVLTDALHTRGAEVAELCLYEWRLPEDVGPLRRLVEAAVRGDLDAIVFTSQVQARHLVEVARELGLQADLVRALTTHVVVTAVGPTCAEALRAFGLPPHVVPQRPKMGPMVAALAAHLDTRRPPRPAATPPAGAT